MVTGIGFCGRKGQRKREKQLQELCTHPEKFHFSSPPKKRKRSVIIIDKNGEKIVKRM